MCIYIYIHARLPTACASANESSIIPGCVQHSHAQFYTCDLALRSVFAFRLSVIYYITVGGARVCCFSHRGYVVLHNYKRDTPVALFDIRNDSLFTRGTCCVSQTHRGVNFLVCIPAASASNKTYSTN